MQQGCRSARLKGAEQICNTRNISICDLFYRAISRCAYKSACKTLKYAFVKVGIEDQRTLYE